MYESLIHPYFMDVKKIWLWHVKPNTLFSSWITPAWLDWGVRIGILLDLCLTLHHSSRGQERWVRIYVYVRVCVCVCVCVGREERGMLLVLGGGEWAKEGKGGGTSQTDTVSVFSQHCKLCRMVCFCRMFSSFIFNWFSYTVVLQLHFFSVCACRSVCGDMCR